MGWEERGLLAQSVQHRFGSFSSHLKTQTFCSCRCPVAQRRLVTVKTVLPLVTFYVSFISRSLWEKTHRIKMLLYYQDSCSVTPLVSVHLLLSQTNAWVPFPAPLTDFHICQRTPLNYQCLTSQFTTCVGIWIPEVSSLYLPCKFKQRFFSFSIKFTSFFKQMPPLQWSDFFFPFIYAVGASKGCIDPEKKIENWGSALWTSQQQCYLFQNNIQRNDSALKQLL